MLLIINEVNHKPVTSWTSHIAAQQMMTIFPLIGRLVKQRMLETGEEELTMMQVGVLRQLQEHPITASELAKRRHTSLQAVSVLIQSLVERGWIVRQPDANDRRQFLLETTPEGQARAQAAQEQMVSYMDEFLDQLTPEEIAAAEVFLPALQRVLASQLAPETPLTK